MIVNGFLTTNNKYYLYLEDQKYEASFELFYDNHIRIGSQVDAVIDYDQIKELTIKSVY